MIKSRHQHEIYEVVLIGGLVLKTLKLAMGYVFSPLVNTVNYPTDCHFKKLQKFLCIVALCFSIKYYI